ncbi:MAG: neutral/alkaline non-lysosomal ceramidase N-terminal domain-containing protein [Bryobacterales bacterium]|nr:neutral/alkaline non-lysosomal ceramidase N-terminal domain-containing protein [Bryobacterales bacterium]
MPWRILLAVLVQWAVWGEFRAAAVKVDITPDRPQWLLGYAARQSTGVHDPLFHKIVALDDGRTQFFLVSTDIALFSPAFYDEFCAELKQQTGIERSNVWWSATHTHSAPELGPPGLARAFLAGRYEHEPDWEYAREVKRKLIAGIVEAHSKLAPARLSVGVTTSNANINRRARDVDGRISLGLNPDGPVDRQVGLIRLDRLDGSPIALIANYAMHGTVLGGKNQLISGDAPGIVAAYVEQKLGAPMLFLNGATGDIAPIYSVYDDFKRVRITEFNVLLGDRIVQASRALAPAASPVNLKAGEVIVETPLRAGLQWPEELAAYLTPESQVRLPVRFLRINAETEVWAAPLELFCEIAMDVRRQSPAANTFYFGYTNGWLGYLPTGKAFPEGGYETTVTPFTPEAEAALKTAVLSWMRSKP